MKDLALEVSGEIFVQIVQAQHISKCLLCGGSAFSSGTEKPVQVLQSAE